MKSVYEVEKEYWDRKMLEIAKTCTGNVDRHSDCSLNVADIAEEMRKKLTAEISADSVNVICGENIDKIPILKVEVKLPDSAVLEFTSASYWGINNFRSYDAEKIMLLYFSKTNRYFRIGLCDYKTITEQFIDFYKHYHLYCGESQFSFYAEKQKKIRQTAQTTIQTLIPALMARTSYEWNLVEEDSRAILQVKTKRAKMMEITLGYKSFSDKIPDLLEVIGQVDKFVESIPFPVDIKSYGRNIPWKQG